MTLEVVVQVDVGAEPTAVPFPLSRAVLIQNLGPGVVAVDTDPAVTVGSGVVLQAGQSYESSRDMGNGGGLIYMVASVESDVRVMAVG